MLNHRIWSFCRSLQRLDNKHISAFFPSSTTISALYTVCGHFLSAPSSVWTQRQCCLLKYCVARTSFGSPSRGMSWKPSSEGVLCPVRSPPVFVTHLMSHYRRRALWWLHAVIRTRGTASTWTVVCRGHLLYWKHVVYLIMCFYFCPLLSCCCCQDGILLFLTNDGIDELLKQHVPPSSLPPKILTVFMPKGVRCQ